MRLLDAGWVGFNHSLVLKVASNPHLPQKPINFPAMTSRLLTAAVLIGGTLFVSCVPYPEYQGGARRGAGTDPNAKVLTPEELEAKKKDELKKKEEAEKKKKEEELAKGLNPDKPEGTPPGDNTPKPDSKPPKKDWPFANPVPGKEGFVFSPYNNKMVDVRDIPSGTLVQDPTYPAAEQKRFRVP